MNIILKNIFIFLLLLGNSPCFTYGQQNKKWGSWTEWGSISENRYRNPILPADYSDIDSLPPHLFVVFPGEM